MSEKVFISYKNTENGESTRDSVMAKELYDALTEYGVECFFSNDSLREHGASDYRAIIDKALDDCCILVVVATSADHVNSKWVEYEWNGFLNDLLDGRKKGKIFSYIDGISPGVLPRALRTAQSFKKGECTLYDIVVHIKNAVNEFCAEQKKQTITKIVLTGGPCAGKTTAQSWIQNNLPKYGYTVLFVPETATELITGGVTPWDCRTNLDYQRCQMQLQLEKERIFEQGARTMAAEKILIVCDRGAMDNRAYMTDLEFLRLREELHMSEVEMRDQYDAVFHLVTAAKGALEAYTTANNAARRETPEEAIALDDKLVAAWTGHPHLRVIDNSTDFEDKLKRLLREILHFLGEQETYEIERKYLIEYPDLKWLEAQPSSRKVEIIQTYLRSAPDEEVRLRQRGSDGHYTYSQTTKRSVSAIKRVEIERKLSQSEYLELLMNADTTKRQIRKTRYCLMYDNQYFEIDVFPFWQDKAIAEIELSDEAQEVRLPEELKVIKEVTDDPHYRNVSLAAAENP